MEGKDTQQGDAAADDAAVQAEIDRQAQEHIEGLGKVGAAMHKAGIAVESKDVTPKDDAPGKGKDDADTKAKPAPKAKGKVDDAADADAPVELTPRQREAGRQLRISEESMRAMTPEALKATEEAGMALRKAHSEAGQKPPKKKGDAEPDDSASDDDAGEKGSADAGEKKQFDADDWYTPEGAQKLNSLINDVEGLKSDRQDNSEQQVERDTDQWFDSLDPEVFGELFGRGKTAALEDESNESLARTEIIEKAVTCRKVAAADGQPITQDQACEMALGMHYPQQAAQQERKRIEQQVKDRRDQQTTPPSKRRRRPTKPGTRAEKLEVVGTAMDNAGIPRR